MNSTRDQKYIGDSIVIALRWTATSTYSYNSLMLQASQTPLKHLL